MARTLRIKQARKHGNGTYSLKISGVAMNSYNARYDGDMLIYSSKEHDNYLSENKPMLYITWNEPTEITDTWELDGNGPGPEPEPEPEPEPGPDAAPQGCFISALY